MTNDFPTFGDYLNNKEQAKKVKEEKSKIVKSKLWDDVEAKSSIDEFPTFETYLKNKIKGETNQEVNLDNTSTIPSHILEALSRVKPNSYFNIQSEEFIEKSKQEYYKALKEEEERKKRVLYADSSGRTNQRKPIKKKSKIGVIGFAIIGESKIG